MANNVCYIYLNGVLAGTRNNFCYTNFLSATAIGRGNQTGTNGEGYINGKIDDIRIYNVALDSTNVQALYHEGGYGTTTLTIPTNGLVAWYPFNGNANDESGNNFNGINYGATLTTDRFGKANSAYYFGSPNYIDLSNDSFGISGNVDRTISAWVNTVSSDSYGYGQRVISTGIYKASNVACDSFLNGKAFKMTLDNDKLNLDGEDCSCPSCNLYPTNGPVVTNSIWHHLVIVYKLKVGYLYTDGILTAQQSMPYINTTGNANYIGLNNDGLTQSGFLLGKADDIAIYNRALDSAEIQSLYHQGGYALPVSIENISAAKNGNSLNVNWQTATELNTSHFIIQHSTDGSSFTDISTVKAIGTGANSYSFTDTHPANGINYYRLESVDKDGAITYSKVVSCELSVVSKQFTVYPNPAKSSVTVRGSHIASVQVIDNIGRVVKVVELKDATNPSLSVSSLQAGVYHLRVQTRDGEVSGVAFVKE